MLFGVSRFSRHILKLFASGGDDGNRTHDPLLAGQVLSQLSYTPILGTCGPSKSNNRRSGTDLVNHGFIYLSYESAFTSCVNRFMFSIERR